MGSSKNLLCNLRVSFPGAVKYFCEYLRENKNIFENIFGPCSEAYVRYFRNHASVPLICGSKCYVLFNIVKLHRPIVFLRIETIMYNICRILSKKHLRFRLKI